MSTKEDPRWWLEEDENQRAGRVMRIVRALDQSLGKVKERMLRAARLYDPTVEIAGAVIDVVGGVGPYPLPGDRGPVTLNMVKSAVDTVTSMIAKNQPVPTFDTDGADYAQAQKAEDLEQFSEAMLNHLDAYEKCLRMWLFGTCAGLGALQVVENDGKPDIESVPPWDLVWDSAECLAGPPRQMHRLRFVDRDVLKALFPDSADQIDAASADDRVRYWTDYRTVDSELIPVVESWHVPSGPDAGDGKYAVTIDDVVLAWEDWPYDYFPMVFFRWADRLIGFEGCSLSEELAGIQNKINKINWTITRAHDLSNSYVLVEAIDQALKIRASGGSDPLQLLPYKGTKEPKFVTPPAVTPELYEHLIFLVQQALRIAGISEMSATSQAPAQLESAVALNTYNDLNNQRFAIQAQRYERAIMELVRQLIRLMHRIGDGKLQQRWRSNNLARTIKWSEVDLDEEMYVMSIRASSITSRTPAGKIQAAVELGNAGLLEKDEIRRLIDHPDLKRSMDLANATERHAEAIIMRLSRGKYAPPDKWDNLPVVTPYIAQAFMDLADRGAPDTILDGFRLWLTHAIEKMQPPTAQGPAPGMPGAGPGGPPPAPSGPAGPALELTPGVVA